MFGYVRPYRDEMKVRDWNLWQQNYCGLCRCLGKRHGFAARFLLNYDMTFLYGFLTMDQMPGKPEKRWCPGRVFCRKPCRKTDPAMEYTADLTVLLTWWKLQDERKDGGFFRRLAAGAASLLFRRAYRRAAVARQEEDRQIRSQLAILDRLEAERSDSIDRTADAFAKILQSCAAWWKDPAQRRPAEQALYQIGRYVYLIDAFDDLRKDCISDSYNPLRQRFQTESGALSPADRQYLIELMDTSIDLTAAAFELMDRKASGAVTENIIYYGLPAVLKAVSEGSFDTRKKQVKQ